MQYTDIRFPHLGIVLSHVGRYISIGNFQIMFYGIIIACGFLAGLVVAQQEAKRTGQNPEIYMDYLLWMMIPAIMQEFTTLYFHGMHIRITSPRFLI